MNIAKLLLNGVTYDFTDKDAQSKINEIKGDTYTKAEVDEAISGIDVTEQLKDYAKTADVADMYQPKGDYLTEHQSLDNYYNKAEVDSAIDAIEVPTKVSELINDSKYQTEAQVNAAIQKVVGAAPEALDTLEEIAAKLSDDSDAITAINGVLAGKANSADVYTKEEVDAAVEGVDLTPYETIEGAAGKYQPKGDYLTEHLDISNLATKAELPKFWIGTEAQYNAITTKDSDTFYYISE